jgi:CspA family cold shock protein
MAFGRIKTFDARKGAGLITPEAGGEDVYLHISAVERAGLSALAAGERVSYDLQIDRARGRSYAVNLELA